MKKRMLIGLVTISILLAFGTSCFAFWATNVADTTKRGSFLIFPLIKAGDPDIDTIVSISNDAASTVYLKCFYKYPRETLPCLCDDFTIKLTAYQEISFSVKTGMNYDGNPIPFNGQLGQAFRPNQIGELKCFAIDGLSAMYPISYNFLKGEATINEGANMTWQYSAWRFAVGNGIASGKRVGTSNALQLTGTYKTYDACPARLIFPFIENTKNYITSPQVEPFDPFSWTGGVYQSVENTLTLVPCKQDCVSGSEGNNTITKVDLIVWNEDEMQSSGAWACVGCDSGNFYSDSLRSTKLHKPEVFTVIGDTGPPSKIIVTGPRLAPCGGESCNSTLAVPVIGVMSHQFYSPSGPIAGETPTSTPYFNKADNQTLYGQGWLLDCNGDNASIPVTFTFR